MISDASIMGVSDVSTASVLVATFIGVSDSFDSFTAVVSDASDLDFSKTFLERFPDTSSPLSDTSIILGSNIFTF